MKKLVSVFVLIVAVFVASDSFAQTKVKFGHLDFAKLYSMMPELDSVRVFLMLTINPSRNNMRPCKLNWKINLWITRPMQVVCQRSSARTKEAEINDLKERMDAFEAKATQDLQTKEAELTAPVIERARKRFRRLLKRMDIPMFLIAQKDCFCTLNHQMT